MIVAIHQPQYLPWIPYFLKILESDIFIILDSVDFQKNGLQNRNCIKTAQGACWLTVPVRQRLGQKISEVEIENKINWRKKHWKTIALNYAKAKYFHLYEDELKEIYEKDWSLLSELNIHMIQLMNRWMKISTRMIRSSQLKSEGKGSNLILNLCLEMGATHYLSGIGGRNYLNEEEFSKHGIEIVYRQPRLPDSYIQQYPKVGFLRDISAIDILLNHEQEWRKFLNFDFTKSANC
ncbi:MAG: WbqC family protein [Symploca sp. SIO1B1]|nr:WbqC family protein [Symploca sp. SIO1B1]